MDHFGVRQCQLLLSSHCCGSAHCRNVFGVIWVGKSEALGDRRAWALLSYIVLHIYIYMYVPNARHQPGAADILGLGLSRRSAPPGWCALGQSSRSAPPAGQPRTPARPPFAYPPANHRPVAGHPPANRPPPCPPPGGHSLAGPVLHHIAPYALYYDWRTWLQFLCYLIDLAHMVLVFVAIYYTW